MPPLDARFDAVLTSLDTWVHVVLASAGMLVALALLALVAGWVWRVPRQLRLASVVPAAASVFAGIVALHLHDTYLHVAQVEAVELQNFCCASPYLGPLPVPSQLLAEVQTATLLGWLVVIVSVGLLAIGILGLWLIPVQRRRPSDSAASLVVGS
jgi:hypothetical protein